MHDAFSETIDRLIAGGMDEYDAITLITQLLEQEAKQFIEIDALYKLGSILNIPDISIN